MTTFTTQEVCDNFAELIIDANNKHQACSNISSIDNYQSDSLIFIDSESTADVLNNSLPAILVTSDAIASGLTIKSDNLSIIRVNNVRLAQAKIKSHFADYDARDPEWEAIHESALIHPSATLGSNIRIGPNVVIGENATIGNNTIIRANSVIERNAVIGDDCILHSLVNVNQGCLIGNRVILRPGVIIGNEGFGFAQDEHRHYHRIPHTGIVRIEDDVLIGSGGNIDRATYGETIIKRGVKIDAQCHVAHNVVVDEDTLFVAQCGIAGSTKIGKNAILSGQTGTLDHMNIADDSILVHRCGVTEDITGPGLWAGTPPKPMKEYVRNLNPADKMKKMERKLKSKIDELNEKITELDARLKK